MSIHRRTDEQHVNSARSSVTLWPAGARLGCPACRPIASATKARESWRWASRRRWPTHPASTSRSSQPPRTTDAGVSLELVVEGDADEVLDAVGSARSGLPDGARLHLDAT